MERPGGAPITRCTCDNCRQKIQFEGFGALPDSTFVEAKKPTSFFDMTNQGISGDRVLVAKFLYDLTQRDPDRLDVVVFKFPGESNPALTPPPPSDFKAPPGERTIVPFPYSGPYKQGTQMNYIKRLIGLPGEAIAIQRGKLYVLPPLGHEPLFSDEADSRGLWRYEYMHRATNTDSGADHTAYEKYWTDRARPFQIIRKNPDNILAMRRIVYDQDSTPSDQGKPGGTPARWAGWTPAGKGFTSAPTGPGQTDWLRYSHLLRPDNGRDTAEPELITDFLAYNNGVKGTSLSDIPQTRGDNWVGDLVLETEVDIARAEGELILELSKGKDRFQAHFDLTNGNCKLMRLRGIKDKGAVETTEMGNAVVTSVKKPGTYRLRFANVDERLTVWVDKDLPFGSGVVDVNPYRDEPIPENDLQPASIGVINAHVTARSIKLFRDTYYTSTPFYADVHAPHGKSLVKWTESGAHEWKTYLSNANMPVLFLYVQPGHFLCLGDNSPHSSDGRSWGLVPRRLLLGRALLIYYPFYPFTPVSRIGRIE